MAPSKNRAVFLDRDGVLNHLVERDGSVSAPWTFEEFKSMDGTKEALQRLKETGFLTIVATNQPDLAYGNLPPAEHEHMIEFIKTLPIDDYYYCPHGRDEGCECRKPKPGMLLEAAKKWNIDLAESWMVGDRDRDLEAGRNAGTKTIFVVGLEQKTAGKGSADFTAASLLEATNKYLA